MSDPVVIATSTRTFHAGDQVILADGPHKYERGEFLTLNQDAAWASIKQLNGAVISHPVEWLRGYRPLALVE